MRVVVTGANGNVGTSLLGRLSRDPSITRVTGLARRLGSRMPFPDVDWRSVDSSTTTWSRSSPGAAAVVHLAWAIQPWHDTSRLWRTNVAGSRRVFERRPLPESRPCCTPLRSAPTHPGPQSSCGRRVVADRRDVHVVLLSGQGGDGMAPG